MNSTSLNNNVTVAMLDIRQKLSNLTHRDSRYSPIYNFVRAPEERNKSCSFLSPDLPNNVFLNTFYSACDGLDFPDIGNGIFIHSCTIISTNDERNIPTSLRKLGPILVFGSDGGGGMLAISKVGEPTIFHLPVGSVINGEFDDIRYPIKVVARDFLDLLQRIAQDLDAIINDRINWRFTT